MQAILDQLGAHADHSVDSERELAAGKKLRGIEVSVQQVGAVSLPAVQTANVTLYEKFDVLVMSRDAWDGLSSAQHEDLNDAFTEAAKAALDARVTEEEGQAAWCDTVGAASVLATDAQLASLHRSLDPITDRLAEDPDSARRAGPDARARRRHGRPLPGGVRGRRSCREVASAYYVTPVATRASSTGSGGSRSTSRTCSTADSALTTPMTTPACGSSGIEDGYADGVQPDGRPCNGEFAFDGEQISFDMGVRGVEDCNGVTRGTYRIEGDRVFFDWQKELEYDVLLDQAMFASGMVRIE